MKFNATSRSDKGTSASRRLRRAGRVPAIVYGGTDLEPTSIELDHNEIYHALRKEEFHASILSMHLGDKSEEVLLRAVQWHPYKQQVLHVDFQRVEAKQAITTKVPLHFIGGENSPAVKLSNQIISHVLTEIEITCLPADLPQAIQVDLSEMAGGANVYLADVEFPAGVTYAGHGEVDSLVVAAALTKPGAESADEAAETGEEETPEE